MNSFNTLSDYSTPKQRIIRNSLSQSRYLNPRRIETVPGFDLTPGIETDSCPIFQQLIPPKPNPIISNSLLSTDCQVFTENSLNPSRSFPTQADKILDAPEIVDDYYLNLLSWSDSNQLAVALRNKLYIWNGNNSSVSQLLEYPHDIITSVAWMRGGECLAVGDSSHNIKLFDLNKYSEIRSLSNHSDRVSSLAWNGYVLTSGSRDSSIVQHDMRVQSYFVKLQSHSQEVCGLKWSPTNSYLASGGNDNKVCIWEMGNMGPIAELKEHKAAVKALSWSPWKSNLLASGGGSSDKCLKLWDISSGSCLLSVDTGSQVSSIEWNTHENEVLSGHGYSNNQLTLWKAPGLEKIAEFHGHTARVLAMGQSPCGSLVVSAGADETLRFWSMFRSKGDRGKQVKKSPEGLASGHR